MQEFEHYLAYKAGNKNDIEMAEKNISRGIDVQRWKYELAKANRRAAFIRPNKPEDIQERDYWRDNFYPRFLKVLPEGMDLRFHGTPVYNAKAILESGGIFSSVDINDGYRSSTDLSGEISTSSVSSLDRTLQGWFADMGAYVSGLPCGCIFALNPRTEKDQELKKYDAMEAVDFGKHPEQLYGIFTSSENIPNVKKWLESTGFSPDLAYTFEGFLEKLESEKNKNQDKFAITEKGILENIQKVSSEARQNLGENKGSVIAKEDKDDFGEKA